MAWAQPGWRPPPESYCLPRLHPSLREVDVLEKEVRRTVGRFVNERTKRRPMIVPVVMEA